MLPQLLTDAFKALPKGSSNHLGIDSFLRQMDTPELFLGDVEQFPRVDGLYLVLLDGKPYTVCECVQPCCTDNPLVEYPGRDHRFEQNMQPEHISYRKLILLERRP